MGEAEHGPLPLRDAGALHAEDVGELRAVVESDGFEDLPEKLASCD